MSFRNVKTILSWLAKQKKEWHMRHNLLTPSLEGPSGEVDTPKEISETDNIFSWKDSTRRLLNYLRHHLLQLIFGSGAAHPEPNTWGTRSTAPRKVVSSLLIQLIGRKFFSTSRKVQMSLIPRLHYNMCNIWSLFIFILIPSRIQLSPFFLSSMSLKCCSF